MANAGEDAQKQPLEVLFKKEQVAGSGLQLYLKRDSGTGACNFIKKETLAQVFSCEFYEISKKIFFAEHLWTTGEHLWRTPLDDCF